MTRGPRYSGRPLLLAGALSAGFFLGACTRALVPLGTPAAPLTATAIAGSTLAVIGVIPAGEASFSIFGVPLDARLMVRQPAGISGTVVAQLPADMRRISLTGQSTPLGSSTWVEIDVPSGTTGWINLWNLTEDVAPEVFCQDPRVPALVDTFFAALRSQSGAALAQTVSPRRGLVLRHDWWNAEIVIPLSEVPDLMQRVDELPWGVQRGSGAPIVGSFRERMLPELDALLAGTPQQACNELLASDTGIPAEWPGEYARMNFLSYHMPAPDPGPRFNWRSWALGIEYVDGVPYIAIVVRYQGDL
ncbi:MAG: SH3 domain-containing protein [Planctomycetes bacterium]|nr:SH3 domain-containing protein [Planctomycetota bacterium]